MSAMHFLRGLFSCLAACCLVPAFGQQVGAYSTNFAPQWSPDGEKILFSSTREGKTGVYVMDQDGANQTRLTPNNADNTHPDWSPDGKNILYLAKQKGTASLCITDPTGAHHRNISPPGVVCAAPAWSPDGHFIALQEVARAGQFSGLFRVAADGSDWQRLAPKEPYHFSFPKWTPEGRGITCLATNQYGSTLRTVEAGSSRSHKTLAGQAVGWIEYPRKGPGVVVCRLEGLYFLPEWHQQPITLTEKKVIQCKWSPDGASVLYTTQPQNGKNAIFLHHLASGTTRQLTPDTCTYAHASFSPDGTRLLYNCDASGSFEIYTADADGTNPKRLTYFQKLGGTAPVTVYFNKAWRVTKKESYAYYRKGFLDTTRSHFDGQFEDYDSTGRLLVGGTYVNGRKNGPCTTYHLDGSKASHGNYLNNEMQGRWEYYYPTGKRKQVVEFGDTDYRILSFCDSLGNVLVTNGTGAWYDYFGENTQRILLAGRVVNGQRQGQWTITGNTGERLLEETFEMGRLVTGTPHPGKPGKKHQYSLLGKELFQYPHLELAELLKVDQHFYGLDAIDYILGRDPFKHVDPTLIASFPGGIANFRQFMAQHLGFPGGALYRHAEGKVMVECIVDETGQLTHFRIRQGAAPDLNYEAVRVMKLSPRWIPARLPDGTPQKARVIVPVVFRFENPKGS